VALQSFFKKRPLTILQRILQLASVGGGLAVKLALDALLGRVKDNPELEIKRAGELRDIITSLGPFYIKIGLDAVALLDEFAFRFYQELDYNLECENGLRIAEDMSVLPMVVIPKNYPAFTSRRVHVAEWIEGENLANPRQTTSVRLST